MERRVIESVAGDPELSAYRFTALRRGDYELYRGERDAADPILLVVPEAATPASRKRLEHELALGAEFDDSWAAKPVRLGRYDERHALILVDPGGQPLDRLVGQPLDTRRFLRIAIAVAAAIGRAHEQGLIHRDVKPANILVDADGGKAWLTGFGIALRLAREHQAPEPPSVISGSLPYIAPEQTGYMNRATDSRSDLYALGVTLYELLTGVLPFTASDPIELIHSHIAREPTPPSAHPRGAPEPVSQIVMKLLEKTAEDRYQTAGGLEADLRRCLAALDDTGSIEPFPLAARDEPDRLLIPERLYGRESQIAILLAAFNRVAAHGTPELVLVSGYSGIGKSSVVNELHKAIVLPRGIFISGKFDQRLRNTPYSTVAQAFQGLIRQILDGKPDEIRCWREAVLEAVGANGRLLADLIPDLVRMIGPQPPVPSLPPFDAQVRFQAVFQRFIGVFARAEHPLLIFIDDLQWLDPATLGLIEQLATHADTRHLLLIGAYRDNEVGPDHPLLRTVASIRQAGTRVEELTLGPISLADVTHIASAALCCSNAEARRLAEVVHRKTGGNPFFAVQFLTSLAEQGLIRLDRKTKRWAWELDEINAQGFTDNLVDLMVGRLRRLPASTQDALQLLACVGSNADIVTLERVFGAPEAEVHERLRAAVQSDMIVSRGGNYRFLHDRVQEAAYALIPEPSRASVHHMVGHRLLTGLTDTESAERIFDIVSQLNLGILPGATADQAAQLARLNLQAGLKAKASTAYASACSYFAFGLAVLGDAGWTQDYHLAFGLLLERADCELVRGTLDTSAALIEELLLKAQSKADRTEGFRLKITLQLLRGEMTLAVQTALECLKMYNMAFPERPTQADVLQEYNDLQNKIGSRSIDELIDLPTMTSSEMRSVSTVIETLGLSAYFVDTLLSDLLTCRNVALALEHGHSEASALAFAGLGISLGPIFGRFEDGERFARAAAAICERHGFLFERTGIQLQLQMAVLWRHPIDEALQCLDAADQSAAETGEVVYACYSAEHRITDLLARGDPLDQIWSESAKAVSFLQEKGYAHVVDSLSAIRQFISALRGDISRGASIDEATLLRAEVPLVHCFYWVLQLQLHYTMGDPAAALTAAKRAKPVLWSAQRHIQAGTFAFYHALALAAVARTAGRLEQGELRKDLTESLAALEGLAEIGPHTYAHKHLLVVAELAGLEGRNFEAARLYEEAVRTAAARGFIQEEALAAERAAEFFGDRGLMEIAAIYRRHARESYHRWGALAKVRQLDGSHPELASLTPSAYSTTIEAPLEHLDLAAVIQVSQAMAGEIVLDRLIDVLMTTAIEHAGADRGLLVLLRGDELRVAAEAHSAGHRVAVRLIGDDDPSPDVPASILAHARRTCEPVLLDDAREKTAFAADRYMRQSRARSVLCLPLVKQGEMIGALYLENHLTSYVFTPARIAVLKLLSSQIAISLQNARLYADLVSENRERQRAEEALRDAQTELARVARLTTIGEMLASIAHEINQPLAAIALNGSACATWLGQATPNFVKAQGALERIQRDVDRAHDVIQSLRSLLTKSNPKRVWLDVNEVIREVIALTQSELRKHGVTLLLDLSEGTPAIWADRVQIQQVLLNLIMNGAEAMSTVVDTPRNLAITSSPALPGGVRVSVADSGVGLDAATAERVFESFFTTKATGMGMGLSICRSIITAHDGQIGVEPNTPHGANFHFTLPVGGNTSPTPA